MAYEIEIATMDAADGHCAEALRRLAPLYPELARVFGLVEDALADALADAAADAAGAEDAALDAETLRDRALASLEEMRGRAEGMAEALDRLAEAMPQGPWRAEVVGAGERAARMAGYAAMMLRE